LGACGSADPFHFWRIVAPREAALAAGDVVTIRVPGIGVLSNTASVV